MSNTVTDIRNTMTGLVQARREERESLLAAIELQRIEVDKQTAAIAAAAQDPDKDAYITAMFEKDKAAIAAATYRARYDDLEAAPLMSEPESDAIIDRLLSYEQQIEAEYIAGVTSILRNLENLNNSYTQNIADAEATIKAWSNTVHANHRNIVGFVAVGDRKVAPRSVRSCMYRGCAESVAIDRMLNNNAIRKLLDA